MTRNFFFTFNRLCLHSAVSFLFKSFLIWYNHIYWYLMLLLVSFGFCIENLCLYLSSRVWPILITADQMLLFKYLCLWSIFHLFWWKVIDTDPNSMWSQFSQACLLKRLSLLHCILLGLLSNLRWLTFLKLFLPFYPVSLLHFQLAFQCC